MLELIRGRPSDHPALIDAVSGVTVGYGELVRRVDKAAETLRSVAGHNLVFHFASQSIDAIVLYLACLDLGYPLCLLDPDVSEEHAKRQLAAYRPGLLLMPAGRTPPAGYRFERTIGLYQLLCREPSHAGTSPLQRDLALLLTTSGSTGDPKLVRLRLSNLLSNAASICQYLELSPEERAILSLPMHYSYGLSIVNSHLFAGGTVVLTDASFMHPRFWADFQRWRCTSFAGVPFMYETLHRLQFDPTRHPTLRTMTQAGGALRPDLISRFHATLQAAGARFYVMYGQTEATARISYVPPNELGAKIGSIGVAVPGGRLETRPLENSDLHEIVYSGPNVMMGYATSYESLALDDELHGILHTGDLGRCDSDGFFFLDGRLKRFAKLFGRRINLADVEEELERAFPLRAAVVEGHERLSVFLAGENRLDGEKIGRHLAGRLTVPPRNIAIEFLDALPMTASGKKDYGALAKRRAA